MPTLTSNTEKPKKKSTFSNIFGRTKSTGVVFPAPEVLSASLLKIPRPVRVKIWKLLGFSHTTTLRLVCTQIKEDIDKFTGISSAIDSTFDDFPFHCTIAIRKVSIHELIIPSYVEFLKYPLILEELEIRGEITLQNFIYILKSCPNISRLLITFNKFVLDYGTPFFPLSPEVKTPLQKLRSVKIVSTTKSMSELTYVHRTVTSLLKDTIPINAKITSVHVWVSHKTGSVYFKEILWTTLVFVQKHASALRYLSLTFRDKDPNASAALAGEKSNENEEGAGAGPIKLTNTKDCASKSSASDKAKDAKSSGESTAEKSKKVEQNQSNASTGRRDTSTIPLLPGVVITHHVKDIHSENANATAGESATPEGEGHEEADLEAAQSEDGTGDTNFGIVEATRYLAKNSWPSANNLEQLWLTASVPCMEQILKMISEKTKLQILQLETVGVGVSQSNWNFYKEFLQKGDMRYLKIVNFFAVNHVNSAGKSLPIDFGIFQRSKALRKLSIFCQKRDDFSKLSRAKGVSHLPKKLTEVNFERILLTPWQITRLLVCFIEMLSISLSYWSINDCQFSLLMSLLKWTVNLDFTDVNKICLVDTKIRFKNKREAIRNLQKAVEISVKYQDLDETRLIIDPRGHKEETLFAPRISIEKKTLAQMKPKRKKIKK